MTSASPLSGIRVLDAATNIAGPYGASLLADLGADVVKVEPLAGDPMRAYPPRVDAELTSQWAAVNHAKRYVALDLRRAAGRRVLHALAAQADVLVQNVRAGREARLGLDAASCHAANPQLVHVTVAAFHPPDGDRPGYDLLVQAESGLLDLTGEPDRPPSRVGASVIDHATGLWIAMSALGALRGSRDRVTLRVSMLDVALGLLNEKVSGYLADGRPPARMGSGTTTTTPHGVFPTADAPIAIGAATDATYARLAAVLGPPLDAPRWAALEARLAHRDELEALLAGALAGHGAEHWLDVLAEAGVPAGRVATLPDAVARHRAASATGLRAVEGEPAAEVLAPAVTFDDAPWDPLPRPRAVGRDTDAVLAAAGFAEADRAALRADGAIA